MRAEALLLRVARAVVVGIVEAGLPDGDDLLLRGKPDEIGDGNIGLFSRVMRMRADRTIDVVEAVCDCVELMETPNTGADRNHAPYAGRTGTLDDRVQLRGKIGKVQVAVAVDKHGDQ